MKKVFQAGVALLVLTVIVLHWRLESDLGNLRSDTKDLQQRVEIQSQFVHALQSEIAQDEKDYQASKAALAAAATNTPALTGSSTNLTVEVEAKQARARQFLEHEVEEVRELKFLQPVKYRTIKSKELRGFMTKKIREEYTPAEMRDYSRALSLVGLLPEGVDYEAAVMDVLDEQVAAFYDQDVAELYTFTDSPLAGNLSRMILAHELTHALQDQNFHIKAWQLKRKDNDDFVSAHMAVLEGDATVVMTKIYMHAFNWQTALADLGGAMALTQNTEKFQRAPRYFRDMLMFPYQEGQMFITALYGKGGIRAVNQAFQNPPTSTDQILHPDRFYPIRQDPVTVEPVVTPEPGWRKLESNVVGEFGLMVILRQFDHVQDAGAIAEGWRGDRYLAFDAGGEGVLCWSIAWKSAAAAQRFAEVYREIVAKRNATRQPALALEIKVEDQRVEIRLRAPAVVTSKKPAALESIR